MMMMMMMGAMMIIINTFLPAISLTFCGEHNTSQQQAGKKTEKKSQL